MLKVLISIIFGRVLFLGRLGKNHRGRSCARAWDFKIPKRRFNPSSATVFRMKPDSHLGD